MKSEAEQRVWSDNDEKMHEEIVKAARKFSEEYMEELKACPAGGAPGVLTRPVKSASADGFRCGVLWAMDNPIQFLKLIAKSFWRRIQHKNLIKTFE